MGIVPQEILKFKNLPTGNVCDANGKKGNMNSGIKPVYPAAKVAGPAFTVHCQPGDNLIIHQAIYEAPAGSVLVVDAHGYTEAGAFGEIMATACQMRGIVGLVIDGGCRDADDLEAMDFPVFSRSLNPGGTVKESLGAINVSVNCGGVVVNPGDIIVGDRDGVVVVPFKQAGEVLERAQAIFAKEQEVKEMLTQGRTTLDIFGLDKLLAQKGYKREGGGNG